MVRVARPSSTVFVTRIVASFSPSSVFERAVSPLTHMNFHIFGRLAFVSEPMDHSTCRTSHGEEGGKRERERKRDGKRPNAGARCKSKRSPNTIGGSCVMRKLQHPDSVTTLS